MDRDKDVAHQAHNPGLMVKHHNKQNKVNGKMSRSHTRCGDQMMTTESFPLPPKIAYASYIGRLQPTGLHEIHAGMKKFNSKWRKLSER